MSGARIAALLRHAWRDVPQPADDAADDLAPLLIRAGLAPLAARRRPLPALRDAVRMAHLHAAMRARRVVHVVERFRAAGIEPLVGKGWVVARRFYPDPALRPSSDVDVYVAPSGFAAASALVRENPDELGAVDLHRGCPELCDRAWDAIAGKQIDGAVPTFCDEHHLRLLALHFVKHGGFRALWLCDVAALVERSTLDWDEVLRGRSWRSSWVVGVVALARDLLGADVSRTPAEHFRVPSWVAAAVLHEWETPYRWPDGRPPAASMFAGSAAQAAREVRARWPSPLEASFNFHGALNGVPRLPYELLQLARQSLAVFQA
jgi:hypothetical protein